MLQSVLPGILQGDKSDSLLYGSVDNGKKINWNEDFHAKVREQSWSGSHLNHFNDYFSLKLRYFLLFTSGNFSFINI